jgi:hypothetical protein
MRPNTQLEAELEKLDAELDKALENLDSHRLRLSPIRKDYPDTKPPSDGKTEPPESPLSPIGEQIRALRYKAQRVVVATNVISLNLDI